jgi:hypothetical protein
MIRSSIYSTRLRSDKDWSENQLRPVNFRGNPTIKEFSQQNEKRKEHVISSSRKKTDGPEQA